MVHVYLSHPENLFKNEIGGWLNIFYEKFFFCSIFTFMKETKWSESKIQIYVATQAMRDGYLFHADGNGNYVNGATASKKKLMGSRAGWPDMCWILPNRIVYIELKTYIGKISKEQKELHERMRSLGCEVWTVFAKDGVEAWDIIKGILNNG